MPDLAAGIAAVVSAVLEVAAIAVIVGGLILALIPASRMIAAKDPDGAYFETRSTFGRGILLGLEILVAADLIRTVAIAPTLSGIAVLASLVALRTFLSWSLEVEINGRWPWRQADAQERERKESGIVG